MEVWKSVKAKPTHSRGGSENGDGGQAGVIEAVDLEAKTANVKWDIDSEIETVAFDQLTALN